MFTSHVSQPDWQALSRLGLRSKVFQSILFPIDFSDSCKVAAAYVRDLAEFTGGTVTLLHVVLWRSAWYGAADLDTGTDGYETLRTLKKVRMSALTLFRNKYFAGVPCQIRIESGAIAERIVDYAEYSGADLIMIPTPGAGKPGTRLMGSVAAAVLRDAPCAVWTSPHSDKLKPFTGFWSIVCALAPNTIFGDYLRDITALGAVFGSRVTFASAIAPVQAVDEHPRVLNLEEEYPAAGLELVSGSKYLVHVEPGPVGYVVRQVAQMESADLVVINRRHIAQPLETHVYEIISESPCPALSLPTRGMTGAINVAGQSYAKQARVFGQACC